MSSKRGNVVVAQDTVIKGDIRNCGQIEIFGYVEGDLSADALVVHPGGKFYGSATLENADIRGAVQGRVAVRNLIQVRKDGAVNGNVKYGRIAVEDGGILSAELRNVPPELFGDFEIAVTRGGQTRLTTSDINAVDPDDSPEKLKFSVANAKNGFVAMRAAPRAAVDRFTQAELEAGGVIFVHDGADGKAASFEVMVRDESGATSGAPKTVRVAVR
jgi:cytoskeletal protein CcmA (bactofilin family)